MQMHTRPRSVGTALVLFAAGSLVACDSSSTESATLLESVRDGTALFTSTAQALEAGYQADPHCVAHPELGGMGQHWVNQALIDPSFDPLAPEAILYEPTPGGGHTLVGVEYIVIDTGQPAPEFAGQAFDVGGVPPLEDGAVAHWSLHVWVHRNNPAGTFAPFNPDVSCG